MKKVFLGVLVILCLMGCSSNITSGRQGKPNWIDNPKDKYPEGMYLSAVGYGSSRRSAEADAMGSVARIFKTDVKASSKFTERTSELTTTVKADEVSLFTENTKDVLIEAEQDLINIEIGETYTDDLGRTYALAYIQRSRTADIYDEKITQTEGMIDFYFKKYNQTTDVLKKHSYLGLASIFAYQNQNLLEQLAIISPMEYEMINVSNRYPEITTLLRDNASQINFSVKVANDEKDIISNAIKEVISQMNFSIVESNSTLEIVASTEYQEADLGRKEKFTRYEFVLNMLDKKRDIVLSFNEKGRIGGINKEESQAKARNAIVRSILEKLQIRIEKYFDSITQ